MPTATKVLREPRAEQVRSRERVRELAEVLTDPREVEAMLDLLPSDVWVWRPNGSSTFLEPACGCGRFLTAILTRKFASLADQYQQRKPNGEWLRFHSLLALSSIYGIDIDPENVDRARTGLISTFSDLYSHHFGSQPTKRLLEDAAAITRRNIVLGDGLKPDRIVFVEYARIPNSQRLRFSEFRLADAMPNVPSQGELGDKPLRTWEGPFSHLAGAA